MTTFTQIRQAATAARTAYREAMALPRGTEARVQKLVEFEEHTLEKLHLAGRIGDEEYADGLREVLDAKLPL